MPRNQTGPPCPKPERIREILDGDNFLTGSESLEARDVYDALEWLAVMLENRSLYHKRQQIKNKVLRNLAHVYGLDDQVDVLTNDTMHAHVSSQPPDKQDIIDLTELNQLQGEDTNDDSNANHIQTPEPPQQSKRKKAGA